MSLPRACAPNCCREDLACQENTSGRILRIYMYIISSVERWIVCGGGTDKGSASLPQLDAAVLQCSSHHLAVLCKRTATHAHLSPWRINHTYMYNHLGSHNQKLRCVNRSRNVYYIYTVELKFGTVEIDSLRIKDTSE